MRTHPAVLPVLGTLLGTFIAATAPSQRTWSVTAAELAATVQAAAPGDVILVSGRAVVLPAITIAKPLSIHGSPGTEILSLGGLAIDGLAPGTNFVLQGLATNSITVRNCRGSVLLAEVSRATGFVGLTIDGCADVSLESTAWIGSCTVRGSSLTIARSNLRGLFYDRGSLNTPTPAVDASGSEIRIVASQLAGGSSIAPSPPAQPALTLHASTARISGATTDVHAGFDFTLGPVDAVGGTGSVTADPLAALTPTNGGRPAGPGIVLGFRPQPTTTIVPSPLGGTATVTLAGTAGHAFALLLGQPGPAQTVANIAGELRLAPPLAVVAAGTLDAAGRFDLAFTVPSVPLLRAFTFRWQGATSDGTAAIWAEPATESHR